MVLALYTTPLSANGRKVQAVARHLGLEVDVCLIDVYQGEGQAAEYLAINPSGKIPTLVDDKITSSESNAILVYLAESYGSLQLFSRDPAERATILSWLFWESAQWQPALIPVLAAFVGHKLRPDAVPAPPRQPDWRDPQLDPLLQRLETQLRSRSFLAGAELTLADFSVAGMATYFRTAGFPFAAFPHLEAWYQRIEALDAWRATAVSLWS